ncbi:MAG: Ig-like domain-containing protein [Clostridia bacterium]|nr:Ig-like domain-containing protein [Clostridia bacterium]
MNDNAMLEIKRSPLISQHRIGETLSFSDDGYIGIPYCVTTYYNSKNGPATPGYATLGGTPLMIYVINTNMPRIGTESDASIIASLLDRGYIVTVLDYQNNEAAVSPALEWSIHALAEKIKGGEFFECDSLLPKGVYGDTLILPCGCNVLLNSVYFELDKHGTDGTLEEIVRIWNDDFRSFKADMTVKWVREDGSRKPTRLGPDGSEPIWYRDAAATEVDEERGEYTRIGYTEAVEITDCVKSDGSPIDLGLYYSVIYPTKPERDVPVIAHYCSTQYYLDAATSKVRPQLTGFLFNGYAGGYFDYAYIPMCRNDHYGYFDGSWMPERSVTGYNPSFSSYVFNTAQVSTAAIRYTRYLSLTDHDTYRFSNERIGVYGLSKTSFVTHLGAPYLLRKPLEIGDEIKDERELSERITQKLSAFYQWRYLPSHHGETRYENGKTDTYARDGFTVNGGELQPWTVFGGKEIPSGVAAVYSSCGATLEYIGEGHSPVFTTVNLFDGYKSGYYNQNTLINLCRSHNVPCVWMEAELDHTRLACEKDLHHGVDLYRALTSFFDYYLKGAAPSLLYTVPSDGSADIPTVEPITLRFVGEFSSDEIGRITLTDRQGRAVPGRWVSSYGGTVWSYLHATLSGKEAYTLSVPGDLTSLNGMTLNTPYTATFLTSAEESEELLRGVQCISASGDLTFSVTVPNAAPSDRLLIRVKASGFNRLSLLSVGAKETLVGEARVSGESYAVFDVTEFLRSHARGETLSLRLRAEETPDGAYRYESEPDDDGFVADRYATYGSEMLGGARYGKVTMRLNDGDFGGSLRFYESRPVLRHESCILGGRPLTKSDIGRTFRISLDVYDTVSRSMRLYLKGMTDYDPEMRDITLYRYRTERFCVKEDHTKRIRDYSRVCKNLQTKPNELCRLELEYKVYEPSFGERGEISEVLYLLASPNGSKESPIYLGNLKVSEVVTDLSVEEISLLCTESDL